MPKHRANSFQELYKNPYFGKELRDELIDFRSLKMKGYRAIYQINNRNKKAIVYAIGHRRDIYEIVTKLVTER